jgi:hypothetical protein
MKNWTLWRIICRGCNGDRAMSLDFVSEKIQGKKLLEIIIRNDY